jgi:AcrR family transcriptional regulator
MARTNPHGPDTRQAILEAAFQLFLEQGYHGTSMRQVAGRAGITPAAIYNHFEGKEALFVALLSDRVPHRAVLGALKASQGRDAQELTHDAIQRMRAAMVDQFDNLRLMFIELLEFQGRHADSLAVRFLPQLLEFAERLRSLDPSVGRYTDIVLARAFFGLFMSYAITVAILGEVQGFRDDPDDLSTFADIFLHGVLERSEGGNRVSASPAMRARGSRLPPQDERADP